MGIYEYPGDVRVCSSHKKTNSFGHAPLVHGHLQGTKTNQKLHLNTEFLHLLFQGYDSRVIMNRSGRTSNHYIRKYTTKKYKPTFIRYK